MEIQSKFKVTLTLLVICLSFIAGTAHAANETYAYEDSENIIVSGGDTAKPSTLTRGSQNTSLYVGEIWLKYTTGSLFWKSEEQCSIAVEITTVEGSPGSGIIKLSDESNTIGDTSTFESRCGDKISQERYNEYNVQSVSINTEGYNQTETSSQKLILGNSYAKNYQNPPGSDRITLYQNDTQVKQVTNQLASGNSYGGFRFSDIDAGSYRICSSSADECVDVTKRQGQPLTGVVLGEPRAFDDEGAVALTINFTFQNPPTGSLISGWKFDIYNSDSLDTPLDTVELPEIVNDREEDGLNATATFSRQLQFRGVNPGTYQICDGNKIKCAAFTKADNAPASTELNYDSQDVDVFNRNADLAQTCEAESGLNIGWIMCPVLRLVYDGLDKFMSEGIIDNALNLEFTDNGKQALRNVWSGFNTIATLLFIVAFIALVYSAASGNFLQAYDVKTMLPRILAMAILAQLSFALSFWLIDLFNVMGEGVKNLMLIPVSDSSLVPGSMDNFFGGITKSASVIAIIAAAGILVWTALLPALFGALVAVLMLWVTFILRDVGIIILIVTAPVAFAANVLPGTQELFEKWWKWIIGLLAIYPIMAAFLASGRLVSAIWIESGKANESGIGSVLAIAATFVPYFLAPKVLTMSGGVTGKLGNIYKTGRQKLSEAKNNESIQKIRARTGANKAINPQSRFGRSATGQRINRALGVAARSGGVGDIRSGTVKGTRKRAQFAAAHGKIEDENKAALNQVLDEEISAQMARAGVNDNRTALRNILNETPESDHLRREVILGKMINETKDYDVVERELTRLQTSGNQNDMNFANTVMRTHSATIGKDMPHLLKGVARMQGNTVVHQGANVVAEGIKQQEFGAMKPSGISTIQAHLQSQLRSGDLSPAQKTEVHEQLLTMAYTANEALSSSHIRENLSEAHIENMQALIEFANNTPPPSPTQQGGPGTTVNPPSP